MSNFLSFAPSATISNALRFVQQAREKMEQFGIQTDKGHKGEPSNAMDDKQTDDNRAATPANGTEIHPNGTPAAVAAVSDSGALSDSHVNGDGDALMEDDTPPSTAQTEDRPSRKRKVRDQDQDDEPTATLDTTTSTASSHAQDEDMEITDDTTTVQPPPVCVHYQSKGPPYATVIDHPPSYESLESSGSLAKTYPFTLDEFQQRAICVLEHGQHVLVAAHTSAGKTVVAEYAVAMVFRENARARERAQLQAAGSREAQQASILQPTQRKVIYTAPIKALSNQKYREFKERFTGPYEEIGLMTGDVNLNPSAPCLIMTTEILRSMLYNGSETLAETSIVVFDEIHYMKDVERGIIWEESIIMLPSHIQCVFLSATLSNSEEFAEWIHEIKADQIRTEQGWRRKEDEKEEKMNDSSTALIPSSTSSSSKSPYHSAVCHVVYTSQRPIPLMHYLFLKGGTGLYQIKNDSLGHTQADGQPQINMKNLHKIQAEILDQAKEKAKAKTQLGDLIREQYAGGEGTGGGSSAMSTKIQGQLSAARAAKRAEVPDLVRLVTLAVEQDWLPLVVFSFSRREVEHQSLQMGDKKWKLDLTSREEKESIQLVWNRALEGLQEKDRTLPQLSYLLPLLLKGFAVHHSGLLPLLKELVEILFQEGLIKVLFATETFAMGLNLPARSVVFTKLEKFDGRSERYLQSGEYTQMAGRAGRRGQDVKGIVIIMIGPKDLEANAVKALTENAGETPAENPGEELGGMLKQILTGSTDPLQSKFRLTYNQILNLIRCSSSFDPTYILSKSFLHFQQKYPMKFRRAIAAAGGKKNLMSKNRPQNKRARMGEGGITSSAFAAAGANLLEKHAEARTQVDEMQEELHELDQEIDKLNLTAEEQHDVLRYQDSFNRFTQLQDELYQHALKQPLRCMMPFLQSGRLVFIRSPPIEGTNTTASSEARPPVPPQVWGWGVVIHWRKRHASIRQPLTETRANGEPLPILVQPAEYVVDILLPVGLKATSSSSETPTWTEHVKKWGDVLIPQPPERLKQGSQAWEHGKLDLTKTRDEDAASADQPQPPSHYHIVNCSLDMIHSISSVRLYLPPSLLLAPQPGSPDPQEVRGALFKCLSNAAYNFPHQSLPKISPNEWLEPEEVAKELTPTRKEFDGTIVQQKWRKEEQEIRQKASEVGALEQSLRSSKVHELSRSRIRSFLRLTAERASIVSSMASFTNTLSLTYLTSYRIELKARLRILRRFKHLTADGLITPKGRIAAEIESTDELLITEFIYEGNWKSLSTAELIAILTAFMEVEKSNAAKLDIPTEPLKEAYAHLRTLASQICEVSNECGLVLDSTKYLASFKTDLIPIAYAWMSKDDINFSDLLRMSDLFEGSLIRIFRRLDEFINQLIKAARNIGEQTLIEQLETGQKKMKRGIMFSGSLYV